MPLIFHQFHTGIANHSENELDKRKSFLEFCNYDTDNQGYKNAL